MTALPGTRSVRSSWGSANLIWHTCREAAGHRGSAIVTRLGVSAKLVNCPAGADYFRLESLWNLAKTDRRLLSGADCARVTFGNGNVDAQQVCLGEAKERCALTIVAAGCDQRAVIDVARGYDTSERRNDFLEAL